MGWTFNSNTGKLKAFTVEINIQYGKRGGKEGKTVVERRLIEK